MLELSQMEKLIAQYSSPILLFIALLTFYGLNRLYQRKSWTSRKNNRYSRTLVEILIQAYAPITKTSVELLACFKVGPQQILGRATDIECYSTDHLPWLLLAAALLSCYVVPLPFIVFSFLWKNKRAGTLYDTKSRRVYGNLFAMYSTYWWEAVVLIRRSTLVTAFVLSYQDRFWRSILMVIGSMASILIHVRFEPYYKWYHNLIETASLCLLTTMALVGDSVGLDRNYYIHLTLLALFGVVVLGLYVPMSINWFNAWWSAKSVDDADSTALGGKSPQGPNPKKSGPKQS